MIGLYVPQSLLRPYTSTHCEHLLARTSRRGGSLGVGISSLFPLSPPINFIGLSRGEEFGWWCNLQVMSTKRIGMPTPELRPKVGDGMKGYGRVSWGCSTPPLFHQRSDTP